MNFNLSSRSLFLLAAVVIAVANVVVLAGVAANRHGEPDARLKFSERELRLPYSSERDNSGLALRPEFAQWDAALGLDRSRLPSGQTPKGCQCGSVLTGVKTPLQCPLFRKVCTPETPVGPCMVSSEGTCAAYDRYTDDATGDGD